MKKPFAQVDVFTAVPLLGNPLAVVRDAASLTDGEMQAVARWTNLSETTFLLPPTDPAADYRVRIFTPHGELPFAGHPTLGTCHVWLAAGGEPKQPGLAMQECTVGLVRVRCDGPRLAFAAPPLRRTGPLAPELLAQIRAGLSLAPGDIVHHQWVDNGPGWCAVMLASARAVLDLKPDWSALAPSSSAWSGRTRRGTTPRSKCAPSSATAATRIRSPAASTPASRNGSPARGSRARPTWPRRARCCTAQAACICSATATPCGWAATWSTWWRERSTSRRRRGAVVVIGASTRTGSPCMATTNPYAAPKAQVADIGGPSGEAGSASSASLPASG